MNAWLITALRLVSAVCAVISIAAAFAGAVIGWNALALAGCITAVISAAIVTVTND